MKKLERKLKKESISYERGKSREFFKESQRPGVLPFGIQYLEKPKIDHPGKVYEWRWKPSVQVYLGNEAMSWPGTTGTGPSAKEDERYGENG